MNSKEIKELIQKSLIKKGIVKTSDIINNEYVQDIVYTKTNEYLLKQKSDETIVETDDESSPVEDEKCSKPDYISSLPHDLRTNDFDKLCDRFNACRKSMSDQQHLLNDLKGELAKESNKLLDDTQELEDSVNQLAGMALENQAFYDADDKVKAKKNDFINHIRDVVRDMPNTPKDIRQDVASLEGRFNETSWVDSNSQEFFNDLAKRVRDLPDDGYGTWIKLSKDIEMLGSNDSFDKNLPNLYKNAHSADVLLNALAVTNDLQQKVANDRISVDELNKRISNETKKYTDYNDESLNIVRRCGELGLLD